MALQKTGFTQDTSQKYVLDSAILYKNFVYNPETQEFEGDLVGATDGGVEANIEMKYRDINVDGLYWTAVQGNKALSSGDATVKTSLKEVDAETLRLGLNGTTVSAPTDVAPAGYSLVTGKRYVENADYIPNLAFIGKVSGSLDPIILILDNCLVTTGLPLKTKDDAEMAVEMTFQAHADYDTLIKDEFPWRILYPEITSLAPLPAPTNVEVGAVTTTSLPVTWSPVDNAKAYIFRYGVSGETEGNRVYYTEAPEFTLTSAIVGAPITGKTINYTVATLKNTYVGQGATDLERSIDAANKAMLQEGTLNWSVVQSQLIPTV
ncbi:gp11 [Listeria phage P40]|uniref:major tail protein n=1 Tax=Listeria phage P40 TaxID=560178 RepID=UPI00018198D1|nr:major tail protein [Listeria phage P40]ACI00371.1 gp11 [Listeria phage P40]